jgi:predicted AlkP superfamily phosphohydrolase/phosphomutase
VGFQVLEKARYLSKRALPRWVKGFIKEALPQVRDKVESYRYFTEIQWERTRAYGFGMYGNIYINLEGREPGGIVPAADFNGVCQEITEQLLELRDPDTGEKLVDTVYRREDLYHGPRGELAPDLIIFWRDYAYYTATSSGRETGSCFGEYLKIDSSDFDHVGTHRLNGIFIAAGKTVKKGRVVSNAHIADVAPTVLFSLGAPIQKDMDGTVLLEVFTDDFLKGRSPEYVSQVHSNADGSKKAEYTDEEAREVAERLKGLGYL